MKIPEKDFKIKVGPFIYNVIYSKDVALEGGCYGSNHNRTQRIFLEPGNSKERTEETFLHEVIHSFTANNGLWHRFEEKEKLPNEEEVVRQISMSLYQFILDNPEIFK